MRGPVGDWLRHHLSGMIRRDRVIGTLPNHSVAGAINHVWWLRDWLLVAGIVHGDRMELRAAMMGAATCIRESRRLHGRHTVGRDKRLGLGVERVPVVAPWNWVLALGVVGIDIYRQLAVGIWDSRSSWSSPSLVGTLVAALLLPSLLGHWGRCSRHSRGVWRGGDALGRESLLLLLLLLRLLLGRSRRRGGSLWGILLKISRRTRTKANESGTHYWWHGAILGCISIVGHHLWVCRVRGVHRLHHIRARLLELPGKLRVGDRHVLRRHPGLLLWRAPGHVLGPRVETLRIVPSLLGRLPLALRGLVAGRDRARTRHIVATVIFCEGAISKEPRLVGSVKTNPSLGILSSQNCQRYAP